MWFQIQISVFPMRSGINGILLIITPHTSVKRYFRWSQKRKLLPNSEDKQTGYKTWEENKQIESTREKKLQLSLGRNEWTTVPQTFLVFCLPYKKKLGWDLSSLLTPVTVSVLQSWQMAGHFLCLYHGSRL